jgi:signal transduction histidine kinase
MQKIFNQKKLFLTLITVSVVVITYLHYSTLPGVRDIHNIFSELYYIPLLLGALVFGLKGAVVTFIVVSVLYIPHMVLNWESSSTFIANQVLHAVFSGAFAIVAGLLVDREKTLRQQSEKDHYLASLGRASAAIVHDLKTPLITIAGFAKRISKDMGDVKEDSELILTSAMKMEMIIHDVLDFAKPVRLFFNKKDLKSVIEHACESCMVKAANRTIELSVSLPAEPIMISVDRSKFERALINLINNAIDASVVGSNIMITTEPGDGKVIIRIRDHGAGMDKETVENIFIPFYTNKNSGTGLGMAIAKKIIEGHKGIIHINSKEKMGTEIIVELPA